MSVTPSQFPTIALASLDGTETFWAQKNGVDYQATLLTLSEYFGGVKFAKLTIPTASVLTLNGTPLDIVAAPGSGKAIEVLAGSFASTYNSIAYATNVILQLITDTATISQYELGALLFTSSTHRKMPEVTSTGVTALQIVENKALQVKVKTGNPTAGNSDIVVYVCYRIITL